MLADVTRTTRSVSLHQCTLARAQRGFTQARLAMWDVPQMVLANRVPHGQLEDVVSRPIKLADKTVRVAAHCGI